MVILQRQIQTRVLSFSSNFSAGEDATNKCIRDANRRNSSCSSLQPLAGCGKSNVKKFADILDAVGKWIGAW
jgi:hypothetical protein